MALRTGSLVAITGPRSAAVGAPQRSGVAVFGGSKVGHGDAYAGAAAALGRELAGRRIGLVFGGTMKGLMGVLADATLGAGGSAHGVITRRLLDRGQLHPRLTGHEIA